MPLYDIHEVCIKFPFTSILICMCKISLGTASERAFVNACASFTAAKELNLDTLLPRLQMGEVPHDVQAMLGQGAEG